MSCRKNRLAQIAHRSLQGAGRLPRRPSPEHEPLPDRPSPSLHECILSRVFSHRQPDVACAVDEQRAQPIVAS